MDRKQNAIGQPMGPGLPQTTGYLTMPSPQGT